MNISELITPIIKVFGGVVSVLFVAGIKILKEKKKYDVELNHIEGEISKGGRGRQHYGEDAKQWLLNNKNLVAKGVTDFINEIFASGHRSLFTMYCILTASQLTRPLVYSTIILAILFYFIETDIEVSSKKTWYRVSLVLAWVVSLFIISWSEIITKEVVLSSKQYPEIHDIADLQKYDKAIYKTPDGVSRIMYFEPSSEDEEDIKTVGFEKIGKELSKKADEKNDPCDATGCPKHCLFDGVRRYDAKTTISLGKLVSYKTVNDFLIKFADKNKDKNMYPLVSGQDSRINLENSNVTIESCWLFCFAKESDEDYHLVVGSTNDLNDSKNRFICVEVSGLPKSAGNDKKVISEVQDQFHAILGEAVCYDGGVWPKSGYNWLEEPIEIKVTGSLYWDIEHWSSTGNKIYKHGPTSLEDRLTTVWEIHPITKLKQL